MSNIARYSLQSHCNWEDMFTIHHNEKPILNISSYGEAQSVVYYLNSLENSIDASPSTTPLNERLQERIQITDSPKLKTLLQDSLGTILELENLVKDLLEYLPDPCAGRSYALRLLSLLNEE